MDKDKFKEKIKRWLSRGMILLGAILLLSCFAPWQISSKADFGDSNDYSSDWSGDSYSSDWSSSDYDSDSDSSPSDGDALISVIVVVMILVVSYINTRKEKKAKKEMDTSVGKSVSGKGSPAEQILAHDPSFSEKDFLSYASRVFINIQTAWSARDLEPVRTVLHPNLYEQTARQIENKKKDGIINRLERISVTSCVLSGYEQDKTDEYAYVTIYAQMVDYQIKEDTQKVIAGDPNALWYLQYRVCFRRPLGMKTSADGIGVRSATCPMCGAPLTANAYGKCAYCGSVINTGEYDWVISDLKIIRKNKQK